MKIELSQTDINDGEPRNGYRCCGNSQHAGEAGGGQAMTDGARKLGGMSKEERSLLLFLETRAVDHHGRIDQGHMNSDDFDLCADWDRAGFIETGRIASEDVTAKGAYWCVLSDDAFALAAEERKARARRMWKRRNFRTTDEKREQPEALAAREL